MNNFKKNLIQFFNSHKKQIIFVAIIVFFYWIVFGIGKLSGEYRASIKFGDTKAEISLAEIKKKVSTIKKGNFQIYIQENTAKFVDEKKKLYNIKDFKNEVNNKDFQYLQDHNVNIDGDITVDLIENNPIKHQDIVTDLMTKWLIALFYILMAYFIYTQLKGSGMGGFGKRFNSYKKNEYKTTFKDIAGHQGPKSEAFEAVDYLKNPTKYIKTGAKPIKGIMLYGPPGNGKTLIAKAIAGEADANFIEQNASSFVQLYAGAGAMAVRGLFAEARKIKPCVIFIDEIDAVGGARGGSNSHDEKTQTINALLAELDGFADNSEIVVIAATNRIEDLDTALIRPGRFDRKVFVPLPGKNDRVEILTVHSQKIPDFRVDIEKMAEKTQGFSGADLANLINESAIEAARSDKDFVDESDAIKARDRILLGSRNYGYTIKEEERKIIAYHETGHAAIGLLLKFGILEKITILPHGMALGVTIHSHDEERLLITKEEMEIEMMVLMGGRAAEAVFCKKITSGASNDMQRASKMARDAIFKYGFDGHGPYIPESEQLLTDIDVKASTWLNLIYQNAIKILTEVKPGVEIIVAELLKNDEMPGERAKEILSQYQCDTATYIVQNNSLKEITENETN